MKKLLLLASLLFTSIVSVYAQTKRDTVLYPMVLRTDSLFNYPVGRIVDSVKFANVYRFIITPDTIDTKLAIVIDTYVDGKLKFRGKSINPDGRVTLHGSAVSYYQNGHPKSLINYKDGTPLGDFTTFYPNGKLYFSGKWLEKNKMEIYASNDSLGKETVSYGNGEFIKYDEFFQHITDRGHLENAVKTGEWKHFENDKLIYTLIFDKGVVTGGTGYDSAARANTYINPDIPAKFKGGLGELDRFIKNRLTHNEVLKNSIVQGHMFITFIVEKDGTIKEAEILRGLNKDLDREVLYIIKGTTNMWTPGIKDGKPARSKFTIPFEF
jgi:hypothetical protein